MLSLIVVNVVILSLIILSVIVLSFVILNAVILSLIIHSVLMLSFVPLSVVMLSFIILSAVMLSVKTQQNNIINHSHVDEATSLPIVWGTTLKLEHCSAFILPTFPTPVLSVVG
jgi:hypothetical protein